VQVRHAAAAAAAASMLTQGNRPSLSNTGVEQGPAPASTAMRAGGNATPRPTSVKERQGP